MELDVIQTIVSELNYMRVAENPMLLFEFYFEKNGDLIVDWKNRMAKTLLNNLAKELNLDCDSDFRIGRTPQEDLPANMNNEEKFLAYLKKTIEEYINIAEMFIK